MTGVIDHLTSQSLADTQRDELPVVTRLPLGLRVINLIAILLPLAGLILAMVLVWGRGFSWLELGVFVGMYLISGFGVTIGFHRLFTHKSFETSRVMQAILAIAGSMAVEGSVLQWVATHRCHHQHSDAEDDPHSPHVFGRGFINMFRGLWQAHMGWLFTPSKDNLKRYIADFRNDRLIRTMSALFPVWVLVGMLVPAAVVGLVTMTWSGAFMGLLWGGLVRMFFVHHITWSINSVCHIWGSRPFESHDESRNNFIFGVLAFGEGWHNNHHAFPTSARHGLKWWQIDVSYIVIRLMSWVGLVWHVRTPAPQRMAAKAR